MSQRPQTVLIGSLLVASFAALQVACGDGECIRGSASACTKHSPPLSISYCQADGTTSDCVPRADCNPFDQKGCENGLACYGTNYGTLCAPAETLPCPPGQEIAWGVEELECQPHCVLSDTQLDPVHCDEGELCGIESELPDGFGTCYVDHTE